MILFRKEADRCDPRDAEDAARKQHDQSERERGDADEAADARCIAVPYPVDPVEHPAQDAAPPARAKGSAR